MKDEKPHETFTRLTGMNWVGGKSPFILALLKLLNVPGEPGTEETNLELQTRLLGIEKVFHKNEDFVTNLRPRFAMNYGIGREKLRKFRNECLAEVAHHGGAATLDNLIDLITIMEEIYDYKRE